MTSSSISEAGCASAAAGAQQCFPGVVNRKSIVFTENRGQMELLGRGSFSEVYLATLRSLHQVAVKVYFPEKQLLRQREALIYEAINAPHPNLLKYWGCLNSQSIITSYAPRGTLDKVFSNGNKLPDDAKKTIVKDIICGMAFLHESCSVVHSDLKPANVFLDDECHAQVGDFDLAKIMTSDDLVEEHGGTPYFCAPEVLLMQRGGFLSDVFSFGLTAGFVITECNPWEEVDREIFPIESRSNILMVKLFIQTAFTKSSPNDIATFTMRDPFEGCAYQKNSVNQKYMNLVASCTAFDYQKRPTFQQLMNEWS